MSYKIIRVMVSAKNHVIMSFYFHNNYPLWYFAFFLDITTPSFLTQFISTVDNHKYIYNILILYTRTYTHTHIYIHVWVECVCLVGVNQSFDFYGLSSSTEIGMHLISTWSTAFTFTFHALFFFFSQLNY